MYIITTTKHADLEPSKNFINTAALITHRYWGLLIGGPPAKWPILVQHRIAEQIQFKSKDEIRLRKVMSYGDVVNLKYIPTPCRAVPMLFISICIDYLMCITIRDNLGSLLRIVVMALDNCQIPLSKDKIYPLQAHSLRTRDAVLQRYHAGAYSHLGILRRLRLITSAVPNVKDAFLIAEAEPIDQPGPRIIYRNTAFLATTGFVAENVLEETPHILQCEETSRSTLDIIRNSLAQLKPVEVELASKRKDGSGFWVQLSIMPIANETGLFTHRVAIQRDINERKYPEAALHQAHVDRERQLALVSRGFGQVSNQNQLSHDAHNDDLTHLKNKAYFTAELNRIFNCATAVEASLLHLDLDMFKYVNSGMGHRAGDLLLQTVARQLEDCIDKSACLARIGGDEFAILHTGAGHREKAICSAQRINQKLAPPFEIEGQSVFTSCSIGIATRDFSHEGAEDLIRAADIAMYAAKKKGGGKWALFDSSMLQAAIDTFFLRNTIKHALKSQEFYLVYQPIYSLRSLEITGVEALLRWKNPRLGSIPPDVFIKVAEDVGIICELGGWVMRMACTEVKSWSSSSTKNQLTLSVNVSGTELKQPRFASCVAEMLEEMKFDPHNLQIEITESVFLNESEIVFDALSDLGKIGIRIALDDFGTGYSCLAYLDRYPIDAIKIDRSFINRMMTHKRTAAVVKSIFSLSNSLGTAIVAEGIETHEQLEKLRFLNCPYVQGYLLSPPLESRDLKNLFLQNTPCPSTYS